MESNDIGWATFYNDASTGFSEEFQTEMSKQLMDKFNTMVEIQNFAQDKKFMLFVGMTELKTIYQNGYALSSVEVIAPPAYSNKLTAYWKSDDLETITKSDSISSENIEFGWCSDFDKEFFKSFARKDIIPEVDGINLNFEFIADLQLFPDLSITYQFKSEPTEKQLEHIKKTLVSNFTESYISGITPFESTYVTMLDFQGTEGNKGLKQIEQFIQDLNSNENNRNIEMITIN
ncbi:MAG: hypothetical protein QNK23_11940 [Crocinitomicaceae bacterium]|nr:hypothetical protein [Crocinitomicaceae bacterium]